MFFCDVLHLSLDILRSPALRRWLVELSFAVVVHSCITFFSSRIAHSCAHKFTAFMHGQRSSITNGQFTVHQRTRLVQLFDMHSPVSDISENLRSNVASRIAAAAVIWPGQGRLEHGPLAGNQRLVDEDPCSQSYKRNVLRNQNLTQRDSHQDALGNQEQHTKRSRHFSDLENHRQTWEEIDEHMSESIQVVVE